MNEPDLQKVFITGASSGLGRELAIAYAKQGAALALVARRSDELEALRKQLPYPERHRCYSVDVTDHAALRVAAEDFLAHHGMVDVVIASAGVSVGTLTEIADDMAVFERVVQTNLMATVATFAPFIPVMKRHAQHRACRLVGIASVAGIRGLPGAGAYSASKAAVISYCESLRLELKPANIAVVTIAPGYIDTPMTRVNHYRMPFLMAAADFASRAVRAIRSGRSYCVIPWQMGWVAKLLRILPNWLYDAAFVRAPRKARQKAD